MPEKPSQNGKPISAEVAEHLREGAMLVTWCKISKRRASQRLGLNGHYLSTNCRKYPQAWRKAKRHAEMLLEGLSPPDNVMPNRLRQGAILVEHGCELKEASEILHLHPDWLCQNAKRHPKTWQIERQAAREAIRLLKTVKPKREQRQKTQWTRVRRVLEGVKEGLPASQACKKVGMNKTYFWRFRDRDPERWRMFCSELGMEGWPKKTGRKSGNWQGIDRAALLVESGLTQAEAARRLGKCQAFITAYKRKHPKKWQQKRADARRLLCLEEGVTQRTRVFVNGKPQHQRKPSDPSAERLRQTKPKNRPGGRPKSPLRAIIKEHPDLSDRQIANRANQKLGSKQKRFTVRQVQQMRSRIKSECRKTRVAKPQ